MGNGPTPDQIIQQAIASYGQTGSTSTAKAPLLYFGETSGRGYAGGTKKVGIADGDTLAGPNLQNAPKVMTQAEAQMQWYHWTPQQQLAWAKKAYALGYLQSPTDVDGAHALWDREVGEATNYYQAGKTTVSPWDVLELNAGSNSDVLKKRGTMNPDGSITHTNTSIDLSDKASVEALASQVLQQALGRDPTQSEVNTYYNTIRGQEQSHPTTTTQTTTAAGDTSSTTSGGFGADDASEMLKQQIQNDPEYAKYQSGTTYYGAALSALGAIGGA